jgi:hypothetical protein
MPVSLKQVQKIVASMATSEIFDEVVVAECVTHIDSKLKNPFWLACNRRKDRLNDGKYYYQVIGEGYLPDRVFAEIRKIYIDLGWVQVGIQNVNYELMTQYTESSGRQWVVTLHEN